MRIQEDLYVYMVLNYHPVLHQKWKQKQKLELGRIDRWKNEINKRGLPQYLHDHLLVILDRWQPEDA